MYQRMLLILLLPAEYCLFDMEVIMQNPLKWLTKKELCLWITSVVVVSASFLLAEAKDYLTLVASLIGVTALIFIAKGYVIGQVLTVVFAVFYGVVSYFLAYYGEMITYLGMTSPIAIITVVEWLKHPYKNTKEVKVSCLSKKQITVMIILTIIVTGVFYYILKAIGNANLLFGTISVATSFVASCLTLLRSPYYGLGYGANDIILIILWTLATVENIAYLPMIVCFVMFLINDLYGFYNWKKIESRQRNVVSDYDKSSI